KFDCRRRNASSAGRGTASKAIGRRPPRHADRSFPIGRDLHEFRAIREGGTAFSPVPRRQTKDIEPGRASYPDLYEQLSSVIRTMGAAARGGAAIRRGTRRRLPESSRRKCHTVLD